MIDLAGGRRPHVCILGVACFLEFVCLWCSMAWKPRQPYIGILVDLFKLLLAFADRPG
jgi:hypothetical protein